MSDTKTRALEPAEIKKLEAEARRAEAEADKFAADARKANAEALEQDHKTAVVALMREREEEKRARERHADTYAKRTYRFVSEVTELSVTRCMGQLDAWVHESGEPITIVFDSPGGSVIDGFHLFDHILAIREDGVEIKTVARGYAASMGGILLQAGDTRVMGPNATLMLHEVSFGAHGKIGDVEDTVEMAKMYWARGLDIFAERCKGAGPEATKRLSRAQLDRRSNRKNWWINAKDALAFGLVDEIR